MYLLEINTIHVTERVMNTMVAGNWTTVTPYYTTGQPGTYKSYRTRSWTQNVEKTLLELCY